MTKSSARPEQKSPETPWPASVLRVARVIVDVAALTSALVFAYALRFEGNVPEFYLQQALGLLPLVLFAQYLALTVLGVPRFSWRHFGLREVVRLVQALGLATCGLVALRWLGASGLLGSFSAVVVLPYGVIGIHFVLAIVMATAVRATRRLSAEREGRRSQQRAGAAVPTLLVGAGSAGVLVAKEIEARPSLGVLPLGFVDDDLAKKGQLLHGIPVLGGVNELPGLAQRLGAQQVLLTIASAKGSLVRQVQELCQRCDLQLKVVPGVYEIVDGQIGVTRIRDVQIQDLLRRDPIELDMDAIGEIAKDKTVLVTGAGGSIGSELCRQVLRFEPSRLVLVEQAEPALYQIHRELTGVGSGTKLLPCVADVCDAARMRQVFNTTRADVVLHAAAHKHVPMMEWNPGEAIKNNIRGTQVVADLADDTGVGVFVLVSTDKAVNPTSVMGATKRVAELYCQSKSSRSKTRYVTVRFGNVLGSAGSVVPLFQEQIAAGGPVTVTHPEMKRYFMTIPEACQLILQASSMGEGGEIFVLDMGEPVKIVDLAHDLIKLSGLSPAQDIKVKFTGLRPGEKLFEELSTKAEDADRTKHPKIFIGKLQRLDHEALRPKVSALLTSADEEGAEGLRRGLKLLVPEYTSPNTDMKCALTSAIGAKEPDTGLVGNTKG